MFTSYYERPPPVHPPKDMSPSSRSWSPDPASEPLNSRSLIGPFQFLGAFIHIGKILVTFVPLRPLGFCKYRGRGGGSNCVLGVGFCNCAGDSKDEVDITRQHQV